jgi:hypothetical protein
MTAIVCRSPRQQPEPEYLLRIYRGEPLRRLQALHRALTAERQARTDADTIAFCDHRLPLVEAVMREMEP